MPFLILEHSVIPNFYPIISILLALVSLVLLEILEIEVWLIGWELQASGLISASLTLKWENADWAWTDQIIIAITELI